VPASYDESTSGAQAPIDDIREITDVVQKLIDMMGEGNIRAMDLSFGALRLSLEANGTGSAASTVVPQHHSQQVQQNVPAVESPDAPSGHVITAPMIGTFYVAPAPNEPPFVQPGDQIAEGQTIGIIEAMKIMNEIAADRAGTIVGIIASDGETVEYGSPLIIVEPAVE
jgi:acetyl-CoA carboxylase biotin carboxyl carrier protein